MWQQGPWVTTLRALEQTGPPGSGQWNARKLSAFSRVSALIPAPHANLSQLRNPYRSSQSFQLRCTRFSSRRIQHCKQLAISQEVAEQVQTFFAVVFQRLCMQTD